MWQYNYTDELYHYGVKGMKWGVRRKARKDAKEFARAKMYYGEGAGTRRKLIKNTVEQRSKDDPYYKQEFDKALSKQNMADHATKAKRERKFNDAKNTTKKTARGVVNIVAGHPERVGAALTVAASAYGLAKKTGADKVIKNFAKKTFNDVKDSVACMKGIQAMKADIFNIKDWKVAD